MRLYPQRGYLSIKKNSVVVLVRCTPGQYQCHKDIERPATDIEHCRVLVLHFELPKLLHLSPSLLSKRTPPTAMASAALLENPCCLHNSIILSGSPSFSSILRLFLYCFRIAFALALRLYSAFCFSISARCFLRYLSTLRFICSLCVW